jgi:type VI secretion system secreted protein Hcp
MPGPPAAGDATFGGALAVPRSHGAGKVRPFLPGGDQMADYFLKIDGIAGESQGPRHKGEIELESFSWGETHLALTPGATGIAKVNIQDFHVVKQTDKASPLLMLATASGQHFDSAVLTAQRPGKEPQEYLIIKLGDLMVSSYQIDAAAGQPSPADQVSFSFGRIEIEYRPQRPDGSLDVPVNAGWDVTADREISPSTP